MPRKRKPMSIKKAVRLTGVLGASPEDFARTEAELRLQFGKEPFPSDVYWSLANATILKLARQRDWRNISMVYRQMARLLHEEDRPYQHLLKEAMTADVRQIEARSKESIAMGYQKSERPLHISTHACCEECAGLKDRQFTIAEALNEEPLPNRACTRGWCNCSWSDYVPRSSPDVDDR